MIRIHGILLAGERVQLFADEKAAEPYAAGVILRAETTLDAIQVTIGRHAEAHEEEPEPPEGGTARPRGWT